MKRLLISCVCTLCLAACSSGGGQAEFAPVFGKGEPNPYGEHFTGRTYLAPLNAYSESLKVPAANVTFEPCARTDWHKHTGGQLVQPCGCYAQCAGQQSRLAGAGNG